MATPHGKYQQLEQDIRYRNRIIILLGGLLILLALAYWRLPTLWKVYIPPDLSRPQTVAPGQIPPSYVYAFAKIVMATLNFCPRIAPRTMRRTWKPCAPTSHPVVFRSWRCIASAT